MKGNSLRHGHQLENVAVEILEIEAPAAVPVVELRIVEAPGGAAEGAPGSLHPLQNRVVMALADEYAT